MGGQARENVTVCAMWLKNTLSRRKGVRIVRHEEAEKTVFSCVDEFVTDMHVGEGLPWNGREGEDTRCIASE